MSNKPMSMLNKLIAAFLLLLFCASNVSAALITVSADPGRAECRMTLVSGTPVADSASSNTIYLDPYQGSLISAYDTTRQIWVDHELTSEIGLLLSGLTINTVYSAYIYWNGTSWAFDTPVAWTNYTTSDAQAKQDGTIVKSSDHSRRYVGCFFANSASTTRDDASSRLLGNAQKREKRVMLAHDSTASWYQNTTAVHPANYNYTVGQGFSNFVQAIPGAAIVNSSGCYNIGSGDTVLFGPGLDTATSIDYPTYFFINFASAGAGCGLTQSITSSGCYTNIFGYHLIYRNEANPNGGMTGNSYNFQCTEIEN